MVELHKNVLLPKVAHIVKVRIMFSMCDLLEYTKNRTKNLKTISS